MVKRTCGRGVVHGENECECRYLGDSESCPDNKDNKTPWKVQVYVEHGYYEYAVSTREKALEHAQTITASGVYRRVVDEETLEFFPVKKLKVVGPEVGVSKYRDTFQRT